jgi:hypothetical protein
MLERAERRSRRANVEVRWVEGDMRAFSFNEAFALVFVALNSFLMLDPNDRWSCLARVREHLAPRGRVAIDVFQPDPEVVVGLDGGVADEWERVDPESSRPVRKFSSSRANVDGVTQRIWYDETDDHGTVKRIGGTTTITTAIRLTRSRESCWWWRSARSADRDASDGTRDRPCHSGRNGDRRDRSAR